MKKMLMRTMVTGLLVIGSNIALAAPDRDLEPVVYISVEQTAKLLGNTDDQINQTTQTQRHLEPVLMISHQHASHMLGDDGDTLTSLEALNAIPATAAGPRTEHSGSQIHSQSGPIEPVLYIDGDEAEALLGKNP